MTRATRGTDTAAFPGRYPHIARWVRDGWIEVGWTSYGTRSFVHTLDEGWMVWEGAAEYQSVDDALAALDVSIAAWLGENGL